VFLFAHLSHLAQWDHLRRQLKEGTC
jgi:hypothetical protein